MPLEKGAATHQLLENLYYLNVHLQLLLIVVVSKPAFTCLKSPMETP